MSPNPSEFSWGPQPQTVGEAPRRTEVGIKCELCIQMPRQHYTVWRLPGENVSPRALSLQHIDLVPSESPGRGSTMTSRKGVSPHMVGNRPPLSHVLGEDLKRVFPGAFH